MKLDLKEIKKDLNKLKDISSLLLGKLNIVKIVILPKLIYRLNTIPFKIRATYFWRN